MGTQICIDDARKALIRTGLADSIIKIVEDDIQNLFNEDEESQRRTSYRIGIWWVCDTICINDNGIDINLAIQEPTTKRNMLIDYMNNEWTISSSGDTVKIMVDFAENCRKLLNFSNLDPDTKIYKSIYGDTEPIREMEDHYVKPQHAHDQSADVWTRYGTEESLALINEAGFNMCLMCLVMNTYDSKLAPKKWEFKNDNINVYVYQNDLFVSVILRHPETDKNGNTVIDPDMTISIFKEKSDIEIVSYRDDPKNYLVSVRCNLEDAGVVDADQFKYFVKLFKEV